MEVPKDALKARQADGPDVGCMCGHMSNLHEDDACTACPCKLMIPEDLSEPLDLTPSEDRITELWAELGLRKRSS